MLKIFRIYFIRILFLTAEVVTFEIQLKIEIYLRGKCRLKQKNLKFIHFLKSKSICEIFLCGVNSYLNII